MLALDAHPSRLFMWWWQQASYGFDKATSWLLAMVAFLQMSAVAASMAAFQCY